jgi:hypothetical protein
VQKADVTIVFMHHRPHESALGEVSAMLRKTAAERPLVVLSAHDHSFKTEWQGFWELNTGSLEEFPQWARLVEIRRGANKQLYLNSRHLRPQLPLLEAPPDLTALGVPAGRSPDEWDALPIATRRRVEGWMLDQFAACDKIAQRPSSECAKDAQDAKNPKAAGAHNLLIESAQCGYLGALYDHAFRHLTHRPPGPKYPGPVPTLQSGAATAFAEANIVVDISPPPPRTP